MREPNPAVSGAPAMQISSPAFRHHNTIPPRYTCEGDDVSPALYWDGVPPEAKSLVLVVEDPDAPDPQAPQRTFAHWLIYNLPPESRGLRENTTLETLPAQAHFGENDFARLGWAGPCPAKGAHRYFFNLFALDRRLPRLDGPRRQELLDAIEPHIIARASLTGLYEKKPR